MVLGMGFSTVHPALTIPTGTQSGNTACKRPNDMPTTSGLAYSGGRGKRSKDACQSRIRQGEARFVGHGCCRGGIERAAGSPSFFRYVGLIALITRMPLVAIGGVGRGGREGGMEGQVEGEQLRQTLTSVT